MAQEINHYCIICGKGYHACDSCAEVKTFQPWRILTDSSEHWKIYMTIKDFNEGIISKDEAAKQLQNCDLTDKKRFKPSAIASIDKILSDDKKTAKRANRSKISASDTFVTSTISETDINNTDIEQFE